YPYTLPGESNDLPIVHGVHGVFKHMDDAADDSGASATQSAEDFFRMDRMRELHQKQIKNVEYLDGLFEKLYDKIPLENTHLIVTSDHGELFGEDGFFGHGPVIHEKVFEVFFTEGRLS